MKLGHLIFLLVGFYATSVLAIEPFVVRDIRVEGIQRIEAGTVFSYLPVRVGETFDEQKAAQAIKALYATGFFREVLLEAEGDVLVVTVQERPAIAQIGFSGNKSFPSDKMKQGLKQIGLAEGMIFDHVMLDKAEQEIKRLYLSQGKYGATVKAVVSPMERNRVGVRFDIEEGAVSKIRGINLVGNKAFPSKRLLDEFSLTTPHWMSWWTKSDQYSRQRLMADLEALRSFYMNRGYLEFNIDSTQVSITPDKRDIYITVNITEGEKYTVSDVKLAGEMLVPEDELRDLITLQAGDTFSREKLTESSQAIGNRLGNDGYAFANVNVVPELNKEARTAALTFFVDPGRRVYVRRINITGNTRTRDEVLRREMRQMEASWYSSEKIELSKQRLDRLGYFSDVNVETPAVPGTADQADVNINVTEKSTGSIMFGAGLSSADGLVFGVTVNEANFLGSGNRVSAQVNTGKVNTVYSLSYTNPYYTPDGISRGFDLYRRDIDSSSLDVGGFATSSYGAGVRLGVPIDERDMFTTGLAFDFTSIELGSDSPDRYRKYCGNATGCDNYTLRWDLGWMHDTRDNILFPNRGVLQRLTGEIGLPGLDQEYYKVNYQHTWYKDLGKHVTLMLNGEIGYADSYGNRDYPFLKHFYAGGVNSVRGYETSAIGPRDIDSATNNDYAVGGTRRVVANAELFFPVPFVRDSKQLRLSAFLDAGTVWSTEKITTNEGCNNTASDCLRYSTGVGISWYSPFGPIKLVLAKPLNEQDGDKTEVLQFQLGSQF